MMGMTTSQPEFNAAELRHIAQDLLGFENQLGGTVPGGFRSALFTAWLKADPSNEARLATAFPEIGQVIGLYQNGGVLALHPLTGYGLD